MKFELLIFGITAFFIANTYHDGKYVTIMKSWKKYYQMSGIAFAGISAYAFLKKYPSQSHSLFNHANGIIKYMPIDKEAGDLLSPLLNMSQNYIVGQQENFANSGSHAVGSSHAVSGSHSNAVSGGSHSHAINASPQTKRMLNSGKQGTKRSVSETKKKFVAAEQGWKCGACKQQLPAWFEVDHKIRLDQGGSNHVDNLVALCRDCHGRKTAFENL